MLRVSTLALLSIALVAGYAAMAAPPNTEGKIPPYLDRALYGGGNGLSRNTAVVLKIQNEARGVSSEYAWIGSRYPGAKPLNQLLTARDDDGKQYDVITIRTAAGDKIDIWFDISAMYQ